MKKLGFYGLLVAIGVIIWKSYEIAMSDPTVYAAGIITGVLLGMLASVPVGMLVLAATRSREDRVDKRQATPSYPQYPPAVLPPAQSYGAYAQLPPGMQPPARPGAWYSQGPTGYDLEINQ